TWLDRGVGDGLRPALRGGWLREAVTAPVGGGVGVGLGGGGGVGLGGGGAGEALAAGGPGGLGGRGAVGGGGGRARRRGGGRPRGGGGAGVGQAGAVGWVGGGGAGRVWCCRGRRGGVWEAVAARGVGSGLREALGRLRCGRGGFRGRGVPGGRGRVRGLRLEGLLRHRRLALRGRWLRGCRGGRLLRLYGPLGRRCGCRGLLRRRQRRQLALRCT